MSSLLLPIQESHFSNFSAVLVLAIGLSLPTGAVAQNGLRVLDEPVALQLGTGDYFMQPRWSPDGNRIAITGSNYEGLWVVRPDGNESRKLTDEKAAGYGATWSRDGQSLLTRVARYEGVRRANAVKLFNVNTGQAKLLTNYRYRMPSVPRWAADGTKVLLPSDDRLEVLESGRALPQGKTANRSPVLFARNNRVARANVPSKELETIGATENGKVLNLVVSPDGSHVVYEVMGGDMVVANVDGSGRLSLGNGHRPRWSPDGGWVVYMVTEDDGDRYTASDLYAARIDGSHTVRLTATDDALEMNPDWSPDGKNIAYDDRGRVFLISVEMNK